MHQPASSAASLLSSLHLSRCCCCCCIPQPPSCLSSKDNLHTPCQWWGPDAHSARSVRSRGAVWRTFTNIFFSPQDKSLNMISRSQDYLLLSWGLIQILEEEQGLLGANHLCYDWLPMWSQMFHLAPFPLSKNMDQHLKSSCYCGLTQISFR